MIIIVGETGSGKTTQIPQARSIHCAAAAGCRRLFRESRACAIAWHDSRLPPEACRLPPLRQLGWNACTSFS